MHRPPSFLFTMATALALAHRRAVVMGWSSSTFVPLTSSRRLVTEKTICDHRATRRSLSTTMPARGPRLVMWGEEDAPNRRRRDVIPSSKFSSESGRVPPARRPARRGSENSNAGGWYDDDDGNGGDRRRPSRSPQRPPRRRLESSSGLDDGSDWFDDNGGSGGYEPRSNNAGGGGWYDDEGDGRRPSRSLQRRPQRKSESSGGWDDGDDWFNDDGGSGGYEPYKYDKLPSYNRGGRGRGGARREREGRGGRGGRGGGRGGRNARGRGRGDGRGNDQKSEAKGVKINLKLIEGAGYQHLYGIAPVLNALKANVRNFASPEKEDEEDLMEFRSRLSEVDGTDDEFAAALDEELSGGPNVPSADKRVIKPEAMLSPHLFVQTGTLDDAKRSYRSAAKGEASAEILALAGERDLPVVEVDKGVLNTLCGNRPHQGFVLRCGKLGFKPLRALPSAIGSGGPSLWLALDEVVDPQNLGALLRSAYFLGRGPGVVGDEGDAVGGGRVGVLVCSKNSSPLTPTVSAASAGALEFATVYSTSNLPRLLGGARDDGWRVLGAAAEVPDGARGRGGGSSAGAAVSAAKGNDWDLGDDENDDDSEVADNEDVVENAVPQQQQCSDLHKVEAGSPTVLVLGSEGRGLRTLVARACDGFVRVPGAGGIDVAGDGGTRAGVDSLNVSVTGGILMWHFLSAQLP